MQEGTLDLHLAKLVKMLVTQGDGSVGKGFTHEDLSSIPGTHEERLGVVVHLCSPSTGELDMGSFLELGG